MGEEFHAIIKLVSGEEIVALVAVDDNNDDPVLILQNPIIMKFNHHGPHSYIKVKPWMELTEDEIFIIKLDKIITMTETTDEKLIGVYNKFIKDMKEEKDMKFTYNTNGKVNLDSSMGYVTSVTDARKKLEELFNLNKNKES